jgi:hypothetical protein
MLDQEGGAQDLAPVITRKVKYRCGCPRPDGRWKLRTLLRQGLHFSYVLDERPKEKVSIEKLCLDARVE